MDVHPPRLCTVCSHRLMGWWAVNCEDFVQAPRRPVLPRSPYRIYLYSIAACHLYRAAGFSKSFITKPSVCHAVNRKLRVTHTIFQVAMTHHPNQPSRRGLGNRKILPLEWQVYPRDSRARVIGLRATSKVGPKTLFNH